MMSNNCQWKWEHFPRNHPFVQHAICFHWFHQHVSNHQFWISSKSIEIHRQRKKIELNEMREFMAVRPDQWMKIDAIINVIYVETNGSHFSIPFSRARSFHRVANHFIFTFSIRWPVPFQRVAASSMDVFCSIQCVAWRGARFSIFHEHCVFGNVNCIDVGKWCEHNL